MPKPHSKKKPAAISQEDWDDVDAPPITNFSGFRPSREVVPQIVAAHQAGTLHPRRHRGPNKAPTKRVRTMRFSPIVDDALRGQGKGWQPRLDHLLQYLIQTNQFEKLERKAEKALALTKQI